MDEARAVLQTLLKRPATAYSMWARAMLALHIGDADQFFTSIAFTPHHTFAPWVCVEAPITRFKDDPRYARYSRGSSCRHRSRDRHSRPTGRNREAADIMAAPVGFRGCPG